MIGTALAQLRQTVPAMVVLGPVMAVQCIAWRLPRGAARTTREYVNLDPFAARS